MRHAQSASTFDGLHITVLLHVRLVRSTSKSAWPMCLRSSGAVTSDMLAIPKRPFAWIGACEALHQVLLMIGASNLPGAVLPLVSQTGAHLSVITPSLPVRYTLHTVA